MKEKWTSVLKDLYEGVYVVDRDRKILFWNSGSENISGYASDEVAGLHCQDNLLDHVDASGRHLCFDGCPLHHTLKTGETRSAEVFLRHKLGHRVPVRVRTLPIYDGSGDVAAAIEIFESTMPKQDVFAENRQLVNIAITDELTRLKNRRFMTLQLQHALTEKREFDRSFGVLFIDIDDFKQINDRYGHGVGDDVLRLVASTLANNTRSDDIAGRFGGEEFLVILKGVTAKTLYAVAEKLRTLVAASVWYTDDLDRIQVTVSIGGALCQTNDTIESLVERADKRMYQAKQQGKNQTIID